MSDIYDPNQRCSFIFHNIKSQGDRPKKLASGKAENQETNIHNARIQKESKDGQTWPN